MRKVLIFLHYRRPWFAYEVKNALCSMPLILGFNTKCILSPWGMHFNAAKVSLMTFVILFKILVAQWFLWRYVSLFYMDWLRNGEFKHSEQQEPSTGAAEARMQRVHLHLSISSNGCIAPVLMKNCLMCGPFSVKKGAFSVWKGAF